MCVMDTLQEHRPEQPATEAEAPPIKHNYKPFRILAVVDVVCYNTLNSVMGIIMVDKITTGWPLGQYIPVGNLVLTISTVFFAIMLIKTARPASVIKKLAVTHLILSIYIIIAFEYVAHSTIFSHGFLWNIFTLWVMQPVIAPIILFILSFFDRK